MKRIRLGIVILLIVIAVLSSALIVRQRREARLREALAAYQSRKRRQILRLLDHRIPTDWPECITLEDTIALFKYPTYMWPLSMPQTGIPILVDPDALRRVGKSLKSTVKGLPTDPDRTVTFRQKLRSVLEPMGLAYEVRDGAIMINTPDAIENRDIEEPAEKGIAP
jgi:type II secretory pathway pseudopilin PulG